MIFSTRIQSAFAAACLFVLSACGGGGSPADPVASSGASATLSSAASASPAPLAPSAPAGAAIEYAASSGVAQKGPLIKGSSVTVQELSRSLVPTGRQYSFQTNSDLGTFEPSARFASQYVGIRATGYYFDESANRVSDGTVTLLGVADLTSDTRLNVNLFSTLAHQRIMRLVERSSLTLVQAKAQAEEEVLTALGIRRALVPGGFGSLDIAGGTDGSRALAAVSSVFTHGNTAGNLSQLIAEFQADLAEDGRIDSAALRATLAASARAINPAAVASNLNQKYAATNAYFMPADISNWIDQDGDGVQGLFEYPVNDATASSVHSLAPSVTESLVGSSLSVSAGRLIVNGSPVSGSVLLKKGDVVGVQPPVGALSDGALAIYLMSGAARVAKVSFVKGLESLTIMPGDLQLPVGATQQMSAIGRFTDGSTADLTAQVRWASSADAVARVNTTTGLVSALSAGNTVVSASFGRVAARSTLTVVPASLVSVAVTPGSLSLDVCSFQQLRAIGTYSDRSTADITASAAWTSDLLPVATVTGGMVTGKGPGSATIRAMLGSVSSQPVPVQVRQVVFAAPTAVAGTTQSVLPGNRVNLDGRGSFDNNQPPLPVSYRWALLSRPAGSAASLVGADTATPAFVADVAGAYVAALVVSNGTLESSPDTVAINAASILAPSAYAGPGMAVLVGSQVMLDGSGSVDTNTPAAPLTYLWALTSRPYGSNASLSGVNTVTPRFVADVAGAYTASLVVCRSSACSAASTVSIRAGVASAFKTVSQGSSHTLAVKYDGSLWTWGLANDKGQMGDGTLNTSYTPKQIGSGYSQVSGGFSHSLGIRTDGSLWAWGLNSAGQLGDGGTGNSLVPVLVGNGFSRVSAGWDHSMALKPDGSLWAWGGNAHGQLGDGTTGASLVPKLIGTGFRQVVAQANRTIALKIDGSVWAWGKNLGDATNMGSLVPRQVAVGYVAIAAGISQNFALKADGTLWAWGTNLNYELGDGSRSPSYSPKQIASGVVEVAAGKSTGCCYYALKADSSLWGWGFNGNGALGDGTQINSALPKLIGTSYIAIADAGTSANWAVKSDGGMWGWGYLPFGTENGGAYTSFTPRPSL